MNNKNLLFINFWFLRSKNGMFFYGLDYLKEISATHKPIILLNKSNLINPMDFDQNANIVRGGVFILFVYWLKSLLFKIPIYSPTIHPLPFIKKQCVTLHDPFPFVGTENYLKYIVLKILFWLSAPHLVIINNSNCSRFSKLLTNKSIIYGPNKPPLGISNVESLHTKKLIIGLIGSNSTKKRYEELFTQILNKKLQNNVMFKVYGESSDYLNKLKVQFSCIDISLVDSNKNSLEFFFSKVSCLMSVSTNEGYGRPIACGVATGMNIYLIQDEAYEEFYYHSANFSHSISSLISLAINDFKNLSMAVPKSCPVAYSHIFVETKKSFISATKEIKSIF